MQCGRFGRRGSKGDRAALLRRRGRPLGPYAGADGKAASRLAGEIHIEDPFPPVQDIQGVRAHETGLADQKAALRVGGQPDLLRTDQDPLALIGNVVGLAYKRGHIAVLGLEV